MMQMLSSVKSDSIKTVFCDNLRRYKSIWILYTLLSFLLLPFSMVLAYISTGNTYVATELFFHALTVIMSVILPLILFNYINNKQAIDVFHSLPVKRKNLYWGNYIFGLTVLLVPYIIFIVASVLMKGLLKGDYSLDIDYFLLTAAIIAFYSTMIFIITNCGTIFESITYFGIMHAGYPLLILAFFEFIDYITFGYASYTLSSLQEWLFKLAPAVQILYVRPSWDKYSFVSLIILLVFSIIFAISGSFLYSKRKSESAGQSFAFMPLFYIGSILVSLTVALGFVLLFEAKGIYSYIFGVVFGLICYIILDTIRNRGFKKILSTLKVGIMMSALIVLLFVTCNITNTFGYETYLPKSDEIQYVQVNWSAPGALGSNALSSEVVISDKESIENTLEFHKGVVANINALENNDLQNLAGYSAYAFDEGEFTDYGNDYIRITYTLKNGRTVNREYAVPFNLTKPLFEIAKSDIYEENFAKIVGGVAWESVSIGKPYYNEVTYKLTVSQSRALTDAISRDLSEKGNNMNITPNQSMVCELTLNSGLARDYKAISIPVYPNSETHNFLKENGYAMPTVHYGDKIEVTYVKKELHNKVTEYKHSTPRAFYCAGMYSYYGEWMSTKYVDDSFSYPYDYYSFSVEDISKMLSMVTPHYISETPCDILVVNGMGYIVYPQYEDELYSFVTSGTPVEREEIAEKYGETIEIELADATHFG